MPESELCGTLRNTLLNHQNALQPAQTKLHRLYTEIRRLEKQIPDLENQIRIANEGATIMGTARKLGKRLGPLIAVLGKTEAAIKVPRLESEVRFAKAEHDRAKTELEQVENKIGGYEFGITLTTEQMEREGC